MIPLSFANIDDIFIILKINGKEEEKIRLMDIGFSINSEIKVINKSAKNMIVLVKDSRIAIEQNTTMKIQGEIKSKVLLKNNKIF